MPTRLERLRIDETSGVDDPANKNPDWIVMKAAEIRKEIDQIEKDAEMTLEFVGDDDIFTGSDEEVDKARETIRKHLDHVLEEDEAEETRKATGILGKIKEALGGTPVEKAEEPAEEEETEVEKAEPVEEPAEEPAEEEEPAAEVEKTAELNEEGVEKADDEATEVMKSVLENTEVLKEAIVGLSDRVEDLERGSAMTDGLFGQEEVKVEKSEDRGTVRSGIQVALEGERVTLS